MKLIDRPYIKRVSFLGGECLAEQNLDDILSLIKEIRISFPSKNIWLYTGYEWNQIMSPAITDDLKSTIIAEQRKEIISNVDVLVDGEYIDGQKDLTLAYRGSSNQRVIDIQKSITQNKIVLYCN